MTQRGKVMNTDECRTFTVMVMWLWVVAVFSVLFMACGQEPLVAGTTTPG